MSIRPLDEQKCPLDIQMSIRPLGKQKCPVDIQMSIRPMDEQKCPVDIQMSIGHLAEVLDMYVTVTLTLTLTLTRVSQIYIIKIKSTLQRNGTAGIRTCNHLHDARNIAP